MMSIVSINSIEYYAELAEEDYYHSGGEPPGTWVGRAATLLGLRGVVNKADYNLIMRGLSPSGEPLSANAGEAHRPGWDLTFSPPKSVSLVWAAADPDLQRKIQDAHLSAVKSAISHLEKHAAVARRGHGGIHRESAVGLVVATFEHSTSRALDPQLHTHALVANLALRQDGSWGALESRDLFLWQKSASAHYRAEIAQQMRLLGFGIVQDKMAFAISGISKKVCNIFSKRAADIVRELRKNGLHTSASRVGDFIKVSTRAKKAQIDRPALSKRWRRELEEHGINTCLLQSLREKQLDIDEMPLFDERSVLDQLIESSAMFRVQDLHRVAAEQALMAGEGSQRAELVASRILEEPDLVELGTDRKHCARYSLQSHIDAEIRMVLAAKSLRKRSKYGISQSAIRGAIHSQSIALSDEQQQAIEEVCGPHGFAVIQGSAGAGKTTSLRVVANVYQDANYKVLGAAISKLASDNLAAEAGIRTSTIARLLIDVENGKASLDDRTLLILDEAGLLGTPALSTILVEADRVGCKVILSGEDKQLDAISHGGPLRYLSRPEVLGASRIETIHRQNSKWARQAVADLRDGNAIDALRAHLNQGLVSIAENKEEAHQELVSRWNEHRRNQPHKARVVLAYSWKDVKRLNEELREIYQSEGLIGHDKVSLECVVSDKAMRLNFSTGDRVRLTKNDYKRGLTNGTLGTVKKIELMGDANRFHIRTDDGNTVHFHTNDYCDEHSRVHMVHAYAQTIYASQGITVDGDVLVLHDTRMDRAVSYVAGSRHKDKCHWIFNRESIGNAENSGNAITNDELINFAASEMSKDRYKCLAIEYLQETHTELKRDLQPSIHEMVATP